MDKIPQVQVSPTLFSLQRRFWSLVTAPESVHATLMQERAASASSDPADPVLLAAANSVERLDIYAQMYFFRIRDVLAEQFPRLRVALGPTDFHNLVTGYLVAHPSRHGSLRFCGGALPSYLPIFFAAQPLKSAAIQFALQELAQLEWTALDLFDARDDAALTWDDVRAWAETSLEELPLVLATSARLLPLRYAIERRGEDAANGLWDELAAADQPSVLVFRTDFEVRYRRCLRIESCALSAMQAAPTFTFGDLCTLLAETPNFETDIGEAANETSLSERAAAIAIELLQCWCAEGILLRSAFPSSIAAT